MNQSMTLDEKARSIFTRFCENLAKIDLRAAAAVPAAIGAVTMLYGVGLEVHGESELLQHGGQLAVAAYRSAMQANPVDTVGEYARLAFAGSLPSFGGNAQGVGFAAMVAGPALSAASVFFARGFGKMKDFIDEKLDLAKPFQSHTAVPLASTLVGGSLFMKNIVESNQVDDDLTLRMRP